MKPKVADWTRHREIVGRFLVVDLVDLGAEIEGLVIRARDYHLHSCLLWLGGHL